MKKTIYRFLLVLSLIIFLSVSCVYANEQRHYLGEESLVNTGKDTGYSESNILEEDDPHYGWSIGKFYVHGYTGISGDDETIFLKNAGDQVALSFVLNQDINKLNGNETLSISEDKNGYDKIFGVEKQNFGKGTLIIKHTDYQNKVGEPIVYTDFLSAKATQGADTKVHLFEEGDYEVTLDYEIKNSPREIFGVSIVPTYTNYRKTFKFSVRNGNSIVFPLDVSTGNQLVNTSLTENGFYLDFAKSRYLDINVKKK